jgi:Family of unknown function (DUF6445)
MPPSLIVIDDFLTDPNLARRAALGLTYDPASKAGNYPGVLSDRALPVTGLDAQVSALAGIPLAPAPGTTHGHCRLTLRGDSGITGVHIDPCTYSGILYLTKPEHCRGGTSFYRHRRTGLERVPRQIEPIRAAGYADINALIEGVVNTDTFKPSRWERVMTVPMRYNRLILFDPWSFHDAEPGFGKGPDDGRLVMLMFFAGEQNP